MRQESRRSKRGTTRRYSAKMLRTSFTKPVEAPTVYPSRNSTRIIGKSAMAHTRDALNLWKGNLTATHWAESLLTNECSLRTIGAWDLEADSLVFSPDGKTLYAGTADRIRAFAIDRPAELWSVPTARKTIGLDEQSLTLSYDGKWLAFIGEDGAVVILDASSGQSVKVLPKKVLALAFSPAGPLLAAAVPDGEKKAKICFLDLAANTEREVQILSSGISGLKVSPDGRTLAVYGTFLLQALDIRTGKQLSHTIFAGTLRDARFSPDSSRIALSGRELGGSVVSVADGKRLWMEDLGEKNGQMHNFRRVAYSPDGLSVATCGGTEFASPKSPENLIRVFSAEKGEVRLAINTDRPSEALDISPDGVMMACEDESALMVLDLDTGRLVGSAKFPNKPKEVAFAPDNRCLAVACWNHGLYLLEPAGAISSFQSQPDPTGVGSGVSGKRIMQMMGMRNSVETGDVRNHAVSMVTLNAQTRVVAFAGDDHRLSVRRFPAGAILWSKDFTGEMDSLAFSPDGKNLACVREGESVGDHKIGVPGTENIVADGTRDCFLELVDAATGSIRWTKRLPKPARPILLADGTIGVAGAGAWAIADGKPNLLANPIFSKCDAAFPCEGNGFITASGKLLRAYALPKFDRLFECQREENPALAAYDSATSRLFLAEEHTVKCLAVPSFSQSWERSFAKDVKYLAVAAKGFCVAGTEDELRLLDPELGTDSWHKDISGLNDLKVFPQKGIAVVGQQSGEAGLIDLLSGRWMYRRTHLEPVLALGDGLLDDSYAVGRFGVTCEGVEVSRFTEPPPAWFRDDLLLSQSWFVVKDGIVEPAEVAAVGEALARVREECRRAQAPGAANRSKEYDPFLTWMWGNRLTRTVAPTSAVRLVDAVETSLQSPTQENVHFAYYAAPWHPLAGFGLAATEENATRANYLRKWGLLRLKAARNEGVTNDALARYCGLAARMSGKAGDQETALDILAFAESNSLANPLLDEAKAEIDTTNARTDKHGLRTDRAQH